MTKHTRYAVAGLVIFAVLFSYNYVGAEQSDGTPPVLIKTKERIASAFSVLNEYVSGAASDLSKTGLNSTGARKVLQELCESAPFITDCAIVDLNGRMIAVEPAEYKQHEGADIGTQEHIIELHRTKKPVFSKVFRAVEGFYAVDLEHPVFSGKKMIGSVSVLFRPEIMLWGIIRPLAHGTPLEFMVMQKDSRILYNTDREGTGRLIFTDPIYRKYTDFLSLANRMAKEKSGTGSYRFLSEGMGKPVRKKVSWTTVNLFTTEWRIAASQPVSEEMSGAKSDGAYDAALRRLAADAEFVSSLAAESRNSIFEFLKRFYTSHPGLYAVQWVDANGVNKLGYPEENSLIDYDFHTGFAPSSGKILAALDRKEDTSFDSILYEGKEGHFVLVPVRKESAFLGFVYIIKIKK